MTNNQQQPQRGVALLTELRRTMPIRPLAYYEHLVIAERQATHLHDILGQRAPGVALDWLTDGSFENLDVLLLPRWKMDKASGATKWKDGRWTICIRRSDSHARRRFTLCHEFKHMLDGHRDRVTYRGITPVQRELIAHYFAACYLMPKTWVRYAWTHRLQDVEALAGLFKVSEDAMRKRLTYLQYLDDQPDRPTTTYFRAAPDRLFGQESGAAA